MLMTCDNRVSCKCPHDTHPNFALKDKLVNVIDMTGDILNTPYKHDDTVYRLRSISTSHVDVAFPQSCWGTGISGFPMGFLAFGSLPL